MQLFKYSALSLNELKIALHIMTMGWGEGGCQQSIFICLSVLSVCGLAFRAETTGAHFE